MLLLLLSGDGTPGKSARLRVHWTLSDAKGRPLQQQTSTLQEDVGTGMEALVAAQSRLLSRLAAEMAPSILASP
ncbi:MAG: ABC-type transport auxiliary lipoprotein family protein [Desulfuromonadaceae bacterium]